MYWDVHAEVVPESDQLLHGLEEVQLGCLTFEVREAVTCMRFV
jgi:hypothetical protein